MPDMEIFDGHRALFRPLFTPAIALGNFDGVHLGHQRLLSETLDAARRLGGDSVVLTFEPHPAQVLAPHAAPPLLTTRARKLELVAAAGIRACIVEPFTPELARLAPDEFARSILVDIIGARHVVVGYDFTYGHNRAGNADTLQEFGRDHGFAVQVIEPVTVDGVIASSTAVRERVRSGDMAGARPLLGRNYDVDGTVVRGDGRGRSIGIPTANLELGGTLLPARGVYAVRVRIIDGDSDGDGDARGGGSQRSATLPGVANLGMRPTFTDREQLTVEVHLLDFSGDLYGRALRVEFVDRLRGEQRFPDVDALVQQIRADIDRARHILHGASSC